MNIYGNYTTRQVIDWLMEQPEQNDPDNLLDALIVLTKIVDKQQAQINTAISAAAKAEREACAMIAEKRSTGLTTDEIRASVQTARSIAAAIRARNEAAK